MKVHVRGSIKERLFFKLQNYISKMIGDVRVEGEDDW